MVLSGKNRSRKFPAGNVFQMITSLHVGNDGSVIPSGNNMGMHGNNMIRELLACYLVLLNNLERGQLTE